MENPRDILPEGFFNIPRPIITSEEALKDVIPIDWDDMIVKKEDKEDKKKEINKKGTKE